MSLKKGKQIEQNFSKFFEKVIWSERDQDMFEHWDLKVLEDEKWYKYDVKGLKKIKRHDKTTNESIHWVELKNVHGNLGWLYGEADRFAFELCDYFMIIDKTKLQDFIKEKCAKKELSNYPEPYKFYRRNGRSDLLTVARSFDMMLISEYLLRKEDGKKIKIKFEDYVPNMEGREI